MIFSPDTTQIQLRHECNTYAYVSHLNGAVLCTMGTIARLIEINRDVRGICGPQGQMWQRAKRYDSCA